MSDAPRPARGRLAEALNPLLEEFDGCCQTNSQKSQTVRRSCRSDGEKLTPFAERGVAKIFEAGSAFQGSVVVEVVVD